MAEGPAYRIETPRLVLRCWIPKDAPLLNAAIEESLRHLRPWMPWARDEPQTVEAKTRRIAQFQEDFDAGRDFVYGIFSPDEKRVLGGTGLHTRVGADAREIGYWIHKGYINRGLATEASAALTKVAFLVDGVARVEIHCSPENLRSAAVPRKLAFTHESRLHTEPDGLEKMIWVMSRAEYAGSPASRCELRAFDVDGSQIL